MLAQNSTRKYDQPIVYACRLLNKAEHNYTIKERKALVMVYVLHKLRSFLLRNKYIFHADHMALVYLVNKPLVFGRIARWLLLFLEYAFTILQKPSKTHVVVFVLYILLNSSKQLGAPNQTVDASLFSVEPIQMQEVKNYLEQVRCQNF